MQHTKTIEDIYKEEYENNKDMFEDLEQFDTTKTIRTKGYINFTINKSVLRRFRTLCKKNNINMSATIEKFMDNFFFVEIRPYKEEI